MNALPSIVARLDLTSAGDYGPVIGHAGLTAGSGQVDGAFENIAGKSISWCFDLVLDRQKT